MVGDNVERLRHAVNTALSRSGLLIMTGGLGPTTDDLTKETTAACAGKKLALHQPAWNAFRTTSMKSTISENQEKQAWLPEAATCSKTTTAPPGVRVPGGERLHHHHAARPPQRADPHA